MLSMPLLEFGSPIANEKYVLISKLSRDSAQVFNITQIAVNVLVVEVKIHKLFHLLNTARYFAGE